MEPSLTVVNEMDFWLGSKRRQKKFEKNRIKQLRKQKSIQINKTIKKVALLKTKKKIEELKNYEDKVSTQTNKTLRKLKHSRTSIILKKLESFKTNETIKNNLIIKDK